MRKLLILPIVLVLSYTTPPVISTVQTVHLRHSEQIVKVQKIAKKSSKHQFKSAAEKKAFHAWIRHLILQRFYDGLEAAAIPACGGDLPSCCTVEHESHGDIYAVEPGHRGAPYGDPGDPWHHASGKWQFMPSTWNHYKEYPYAAAAPALIQNDKAREVFAGGSGASNWYGDACYNGR